MASSAEMWLGLSIVVIITWCNVGGVVQTSEHLEVMLDDGPVRGYLRSSYDNRTFVAFEGIPYARAPIGELRFANPVEPAKWSQILHANKTYLCMQLLPIALLGNGVVGQEDCLYMNVYIPGDRLPTKQYDVVVHIHGGAFILGAPKLMAGPKYIMNEEVIYVTFNYRLGIFGFLSTQDASATGNFGLKDQLAALRWIRHNILRFGGNAESITLTGHSAGGASVHYHVLSEHSQGLFHRAMLMSGTALNPWALTERPLAKAQKLGILCNCSSAIAGTTMDLVECLRAVDARTLAASMKEFFVFARVLPVTPFGPVVEPADVNGTFMTRTPYEMLTSGEPLASDVPMIFSFVKDEGIFPSGYFATVGLLPSINRRWDEVMPYGLDVQDTVAGGDWRALTLAVRAHYFPGTRDVSAQSIANLTQMWTDRFYLVPQQKAIRLHRTINTSPLYLYYFDYDSPAFVVFPTVKGVAHSEDLQLVFNLGMGPARLSAEDDDVSHLLTGIVRNFARDSIPMPGWQPLRKLEGNDSDEDLALDYYHISQGRGNSMGTRQELGPEDFWDGLQIHEDY